MGCSRDPSHRLGPWTVPEIHLTHSGSMDYSRDPSHRVGPWAVPEIHLTHSGSMDYSRDPSHRVGPWTVPEIHLTGWVHGLFQRSISQGGSMGCSRDPSRMWVDGLFQRSMSHRFRTMRCSRDPRLNRANLAYMLWKIAARYVKSRVLEFFKDAFTCLRQ